MKILFIIPYTPTLIRTRPNNLLRALQRRGHKLTLATLWENQSERQVIEEFTGQGVEVIAFPLTRTIILQNLFRGLLSRDPLQARYCWQPALAKAAGQALKNRPFDVVHIEHLRGAKYGLRLKGEIRKMKCSLPVVWDSVDCISLLFELAAKHSRGGFGRWVTRLELPRTRRYEAYLLDQFDQVLVTAPQDKEALEGLKVGRLEGLNVGKAEGGKVKVLRNGVDLGYFKPDETPRQADTLVFSGKLSYHANLTAALYLVQEIMPHVWSKRPQVTLQIVGKGPSPELRKLAEGEPRLQVTGTVPDMRPYLQAACVAIAPLQYGVGIQNKVLEAMACGTPVVATPQAVLALEHLRPGKEALVASDADGLAEAVLNLLEHTDLRRQVGENGLAYVHRWHDWDIIAEELEGIYREIIKNHHSDAEST